VRTENMEKNLFAQNGLLMSEAVMMGLSDTLGRQQAHDIVYSICMDVFEKGGSLKDALLQDTDVSARLTESDIERMLEPHGYIGHAGDFVDQVLANSLE
ncbi:MAG: adenylosuccinate lyase, partial [Advenella sp.]